MATAPIHPAQHQFTLVRCAMGIAILGMCVPDMAEIAITLARHSWRSLPSNHDLVGVNGYIDLFHANFSNGPEWQALLEKLSGFGPVILFAIGAVALLRGPRVMTLLVKRAFQ